MALGTIRNILSVPELRKRIGWTFVLLFIYMLGTWVPLPGIDLTMFRAHMDSFQKSTMGKVFGFANILSGGSMENYSVFFMGIMPYISASIIFQILTKVVPALERMSKEGEGGRRRINKWTRLATIGVAFIQGMTYAYTLKQAGYSGNGGTFIYNASFLGFILPTVLSWTAGTMFLMWLGEQISEHGVGNGISMIIMAGIVQRAPKVIGAVSQDVGRGISYGTVAVLLGLYVFMVVAIVFVTQAQRRIPMQSARQVRGRMAVSSQKTYFPLKLNAAGVIPVIFASALLTFPAGIMQILCRWNGWPQDNWFHTMLTREGGVAYMLLYSGLIFVFTYFYTAMVFNPTEIADNLKQHGAFIPGIRPGRSTAEYIEKVMNRVTFTGAFFLAFISLVPVVVQEQLGVPPLVANFLGGTSLLIVVGVGLDLVQKVESHLLLRQYKGFLGGASPIRGRG